MQVCWLHVSDFHFQAGDGYDRNVVLRALVASVEGYRKRGRKPDLIFATGDVAYSGSAGEYQLATPFFDALLAAAGLERRQLFVVPGNHDCDRIKGRFLLRTLQTREDADGYFAPDTEKLHLLNKQAAFIDWYDEYFAVVGRKFPRDSTCGPVELVAAGSARIGLLPLNSALFSQGDDDHAKLWIGRRCLDQALVELNALDADIKVALLHHPLDWLSDVERSNIRTALQGHVDFILRGHLHENDIEQVVTPSGGALHLAAGAAYQKRLWPNRALYVTVDDAGATVFPIRYEDQPREVWVVDPSLFPEDERHERRFAIPRLTAAPAKSARPTAAPARFRSNMTARGNSPFVGRDALLEQIASQLSDPNAPNVVVLHGPPGVGKSELARAYAQRNQVRYPGGIFFIDASAGAEWIDLARIGANSFELDFPPHLSLRDQCERTLVVIANLAEPALLIYDNVADLDSAQSWLPRLGMRCHAIVTTVREPRDQRWPALHVAPLTEVDASQLIQALGGAAIPPSLRASLVEHAQGLPVQLVPAALMFASEARRGRIGTAAPRLVRQAEHSFQLVYDRLPAAVRLLLHAAAFLNPQRIPVDELQLQVCEPAAWDAETFRAQLDQCQDLHLLEGTVELRMHQLFAAFVLERTLPEQESEALKAIRETQRGRFLELAKALSQAPARTELAASLPIFPLNPAAWERAGSQIDALEGEVCGDAVREIGKFALAMGWYQCAVTAKECGDIHGRVDHLELGKSLNRVGYCLSSVGDYAGARPWYERAVAEHERGDIHARVDHQELGKSLHQVGYCLSSVGDYAGARPWYERAVVETERGDVHGRVDHVSLGVSLHQVGYCLSSVGDHAGARPWYERAMAAKERGDIQGRMDHESLGVSLHQVGYCLSSVGDYAGARPWYERAVVEAERGDVHGRVDHESLGVSLQWVGGCLSSVGDYASARAWYERAVAAQERGDIHGRVNQASRRTSLVALASCMQQLGNHIEAKQLQQRADELKASQ